MDSQKAFIAVLAYTRNGKWTQQTLPKRRSRFRVFELVVENYACSFATDWSSQPLGCVNAT